MTTDRELPACDFVLDGVKDGCYYDYTVRRLIDEAITAERDAIITALDAHNQWSYDDPGATAIYVVMRRNKQQRAPSE